MPEDSLSDSLIRWMTRPTGRPTFDGCWYKFQNTSHNHMKMLHLLCLVANIAPEGQQTYAFQ